MNCKIFMPRELLVAGKACQDGVDVFDGIAQDSDFIELDWGPVSYIWFASVYPQYIGWLRAKRVLPNPNWSGMDISGLDFTGIDLRGADLSGCNLTNAIFVNADLRNVAMDGAVIDNADFTGAAWSGDPPSGWLIDENNTLKRA